MENKQMTADMIKGIRMELMADKRLLGRLKTLRKHYQEKRDRTVEQRRERIKQLLGDYPTERDTYYRTLYGGKLPEQDYAFAADRASEYLESVTNDRITEKILEDETTGRAVKMCCCAMADLIHQQKQRDGKTAEKVGDYSVSYADGDTTQTARQKRRYELAYMYLSRYGLMFRGVE